jgi:transposase-like protein
MQRSPRGKFTREFREEAVKLVVEEHLRIKEAAERLSLNPTTLAYWLEQHRAGRLRDVGQTPRPPTELEVENARLKKDNAQLKMENEILKKAAAYFARESLPGTH